MAKDCACGGYMLLQIPYYYTNNTYTVYSVHVLEETNKLSTVIAEDHKVGPMQVAGL